VAVWAVAPPPALVDHLDAGDDVVGIERDLGFVSWRRRAASRERQPTSSIEMHLMQLSWSIYDNKKSDLHIFSLRKLTADTTICSI